MLTKDEKKYLAKISASKRASVKPFDPKAKETGDLIVKKIEEKLPTARVLFMGATALRIAGQDDIDIYVLAKQKNFDKYLPTLKKLFGKPKHTHKTFVEWKFEENSYPVELYLTEPPQKHIKIYEILKSNQKLLKEYENLKLSFDGKSYKDYQKAKYEFYHEVASSAYNRILPTDAKDFLGKEIEVVMDRPLGSKHPKHRFVYEANYGYIPNTKSPDGEELDAYYLGVNKPLKKTKGICIAIIHRTDDDDDKLVIVPKGTELTDEEIYEQTKFQEQWFKHAIIRK